MLALRDVYSPQPSSLDRATGILMHPTKKSAGGLIVLVLVALGVYYMLPELRRYLRLERM